jgi:hypothetical protein
MKRTSNPTRPDSGGFALIITITLMVLLTVVVIGLFSLSSISLRAASHGADANTARNNARLGMMLALGELQAAMGPDRRVSAGAANVFGGAAQPHLTGVWETPVGGPAVNNPAPYYEQKGEGFRGWLVSTESPEQATSASLADRAAPADGVELVGARQDGGPLTEVRAARVSVQPTAGGGGYAWAVFDESTKAPIQLEGPEAPQFGPLESAGRVAWRVRADAATGLDGLKDPRNLISLETAVIPGGQTSAPEIRGRFHDFTTQSVGLLTNTADGGLKTDLTSLFEAPTFSAGSLPGRNLYYTVASGAPQWPYLYDHYNKYKRVVNANRSSPTYRPTRTGTNADLDVSITSRTQGLTASPTYQRLLPVIAKMQIVFSIVSHHAHLGDRMNFYNTHGQPRGNENHAVPHLAYDTVITLYNPYDVALDLTNMRIRVWDPPVGFRLAKVDKQRGITAWYRDEMAAGQFHGLAMFQIHNERNTSARKHFTLQLSDGTGARAGTRLLLQPGESKVYSPRVEPTWTWGLETTGGYQVRAFFDWNFNNNLGNRDPRTGNQWGVEAVPGWDTRAGLQTDHMSYAGGRPQNSRYDFEINNNWGGGFLSMRLTDDIRVEARPQRNFTGTAADFQVDVLGGIVPDQLSGVTISNPDADVLRRFSFRFQNPLEELSEYPTSPVITRVLNVANTMQRTNDMTKGGKTPFAMLEMAARTTIDPLDETKAWLYNNPVVEGSSAQTGTVGLANQSYDVRLVEMTSFTSFPGIEIDPTTSRGYFGASKTAAGSSNVPMFRVPTAPASSLGDLIPANLVNGSVLPRVTHPLGNSRAHPLIPTTGINRSLGGSQMLDHSYLLNRALWDGYFFSSVTAYTAGAAVVDGRSRRQVLEDVLSGGPPAMNGRLIPAGNPGDPAELAGRLDGRTPDQLGKELAAHLAIHGPFNVNSTSVDAWAAVISSMRDRAVTAWANRSTANTDRTPFPRMSFPLAGSAETGQNVGFNVAGQNRWAGFRALDDRQIRDLAEAIVEEIQLRGEADQAPSLTLAEFVNRRPGTGIHHQAGILQTAIDKSGVNEAFHLLDSKFIDGKSINRMRSVGTINHEALTGYTGEGSPPILSQGDLMMGLAPIATVRGDTFKIRSYGEARSRDGSRVTARAWCEAVVQRVPDFVDAADAPETAEAALKTANQRFGRRFEVVSFRWLNEDEISG